MANITRALSAVEAMGQRPVDVDQLREALIVARDGAERVRRIVRDLQTMSEREDEMIVTVDVRSIMESTLRMAGDETRDRARIVEDYGEELYARGNEFRLGQVFFNMLLNAAQALPEGRADANEIRVTIARDDGQVVVAIADTGPGMGPEVRARLFTPFFTTKPAGTGLGLSICQRLVTGMGGRIAVESEVGEGTVFLVFLPAAEAEHGRTGVIEKMR